MEGKHQGNGVLVLPCNGHVTQGPVTSFSQISVSSL